MGNFSLSRCLDCGRRFELQRGGGFTAQIVFCEDCGRGTAILHEGRPFDRLVKDDGSCGRCDRCQGRLTLDALPRCPRCRSTRLEQGESPALWD